jgi:hypothetical protein
VSLPRSQVDRRCGSGLQAVLQAAIQVRIGVSGVVLAGGGIMSHRGDRVTAVTGTERTSLMLKSTATVATTSAHHDAEELLTLLGRGTSVRVETAQRSTTCLVFSFGVARVLPGPDGLVLIAAAADDVTLGLIEDVLSEGVAGVATARRCPVTDLDWQFASADDRAVRLAAI